MRPPPLSAREEDDDIVAQKIFENLMQNISA